MSLRLIFFHLFTAMVAVNLIFAQDGGSPIFDNNNSNQIEPPSGPLGPRPELPSPEPQVEQRLIIGFPEYVSCNYSKERSATCISCRTALVCFPSNVGGVRRCRGFEKFCNNGKCSIFPGTQCINSTDVD